MRDHAVSAVSIQNGAAMPKAVSAEQRIAEHKQSGEHHRRPAISYDDNFNRPRRPRYRGHVGTIHYGRAFDQIKPVKDAWAVLQWKSSHRG